MLSSIRTKDEEKKEVKYSPGKRFGNLFHLFPFSPLCSNTDKVELGLKKWRSISSFPPFFVFRTYTRSFKGTFCVFCTLHRRKKYRKLSFEGGSENFSPQLFPLDGCLLLACSESLPLCWKMHGVPNFIQRASQSSVSAPRRLTRAIKEPLSVFQIWERLDPPAFLEYGHLK